MSHNSICATTARLQPEPAEPQAHGRSIPPAVEVSGPERAANSQVRVYFRDWLGRFSHDPSHALQGRILADPSWSCC